MLALQSFDGGLQANPHFAVTHTAVAPCGIGQALPHEPQLAGSTRRSTQVEPHVDEREIDEVLRADAIAKGLVDGKAVYVVVEVSSTGDVEDIVRAERRAKILRKAGLDSIPLVACDAISPESLAFAKLTCVRVWCNGSMVEAAA